MRYFDHNATAPVSAAARAAWLAALERFPANPSSPHRLGARAAAALEAAARAVGGWLGCSPLDVVWTSGATEAANAVFHHLARAGADEVWVSALEHPCVLAAARRWLGQRVRLVPARPSGVADLDWLAEELRRRRPALVALMAANNENGVLQPWREALTLCRAHGVAFACDAAQWVGKLPAEGLGACDFILGSAHKFGGPLGVGFLKVPRGFHPLLVGGPQQEGRRAGTENVPGILALVAAWAERERQLAAGEAAAREHWRDQFIAGLRAALPGVRVVGEDAPRLWNTVAAVMPPAPDCRWRWVVQLDKLGFAVSTGAACASGKEQPSHVWLALGGRPEEADRLLRFSAGWDTAQADWQALLEGIRQVHAQGLSATAAHSRRPPGRPRP